MAVGIALDLVEPNDVADIGGLIRLLGERGAHAHQNCKEHIWLHEEPRYFTSVNKATTKWGGPPGGPPGPRGSPRTRCFKQSLISQPGRRGRRQRTRGSAPLRF